MHYEVGANRNEIRSGMELEMSDWNRTSEWCRNGYGKENFIQTNLYRYEYERWSDLGRTESPWRTRCGITYTWRKWKVTLNDIAPEETLRFDGAQMNGEKMENSDWMRKIGFGSEAVKRTWMATANRGLPLMRLMPNRCRNATHGGPNDHQLDGWNGLDWQPDEPDCQMRRLTDWQTRCPIRGGGGGGSPKTFIRKL